MIYFIILFLQCLTGGVQWLIYLDPQGGRRDLAKWKNTEKIGKRIGNNYDGPANHYN
jgi:hypothetical protein